MSDAERWQQAKALFFEALDREGTERVAFLDAACGGDAALRRQVEALLVEDEKEEAGALDRPVLEVSPTSIEDADLGTQVGAYRLVRRLGRGGMGNVYLAERTDGDFHKQVAVKLIRRGIDTEDMLLRFQYERQILASLDHPNIATLHDGGMTEDGRPYFVMEYVDGESITAYCDRNRLTTRQRLVLFRTVCRAVQHAHRNLVVHRDLKPSNILVTYEGTVKLLDFGIAKLIRDQADPALSFTATGQRVMTPAYASPEQVRGEAITTATDIYQLGVLLYELLTGRRPYHLETRMRWAVERAIVEEEPTRPSMAVQETATTERDKAEEICVARSTRPTDLARSLSGDLDIICLTALQKDPDRRYVSADAFSEDVRRHFSGLPVLARADSPLYRLGKFVQRHKARVLAGVLAVVAVLGGGIVYTARIQAERDRTAQALAQSESAFAFVQQMILSADPLQGDPDTPIITVLDSAAARVEVELQDDPEVARTVHAALGEVYLSLDRLVPAEYHLRRALDLYAGTAFTDQYATSRIYLATVLSYDGRYEEAEGHYVDVIRQVRAAKANDVVLAKGLDGYATVLSDLDRQDEAISLYREALGLYQTHGHPDSAVTLNNLAVSYFFAEDVPLALETQQHAIAAMRAQRLPAARIGNALQVLASLYGSAGEPNRAVNTHREAVALLEGSLGADHQSTISARLSLALQLYRMQDFGAALQEAAPELEHAVQVLGIDHPITAYGQDITGAIYCAADQPDQGIPLLRQSLATRRTFLPEGHQLLATGTNLLGFCLTQAGQPTEGEALLVEGYEQLRVALGPDHETTGRARERLRVFYHDQGRDEEADALR